MTVYLNRGMYDAVEASRLVGVSPSTITTWSTATRHRTALIEPSLDKLYSFHDLISLRVIARLVKRGVRLERVASGIAILMAKWTTPHPLAHSNARDRLATVGRSFFAQTDEEGDWVDVGRGGQGAFQEIILPALEGLEYGDDGLAAVWRPAQHVWINPRVQAGASCIDRTRMPTSMIHDLLCRGERPVDVANDYDLVLDDVLAARDFEMRLRRAA